MPPTDTDAVIDDWITAVTARHTADLTASEFLKAVRALSSRYIVGRASLEPRSPVDSPGKRAAFAAFYAPLHLLTVRAILEALAAPPTPGPLLDLGCGTGVASAAWALRSPSVVSIVGIDRDRWALTEASWTWRHFGLDGRTRLDDLGATADRLGRLGEGTNRHAPPAALVFGWSVNELSERPRASVLRAILLCAAHGSAVLVVEPLARRAAPWWDSWHEALAPFAPRVDEWKIEDALPARLAELREAAGFRGRSLDARTIWIRGTRVVRSDDGSRGRPIAG